MIQNIRCRKIGVSLTARRYNLDLFTESYDKISLCSRIGCHTNRQHGENKAYNYSKI